jgi:hypothetical protein
MAYKPKGKKKAEVEVEKEETPVEETTVEETPLVSEEGVEEEIGTQEMPEEEKEEELKEEVPEEVVPVVEETKVEEEAVPAAEEEIIADSVETITAPEIIKDDITIILSSISHPNKKILAEKILLGVESTEGLISLYGNTRVSEMKRYISSYMSNLNKNSELKSKRGCNGVCIACQN